MLLLTGALGECEEVVMKKVLHKEKLLSHLGNIKPDLVVSITAQSQLNW